MYRFITVLTVLGYVSQVRGDFINPLNYIRYERAVTEPGKELISCGLGLNESVTTRMKI